MFGGSSLPPTMLSELCSTIWFDNRSLGSSRKQGGAAEHLIYGGEKRICRLSFEFWSPHVKVILLADRNTQVQVQAFKLLGESVV